ncbi:MAG: hypothetical protein ACFFDP_05020 [Promethearchaeota archaeon]
MKASKAKLMMRTESCSFVATTTTFSGGRQTHHLKTLKCDWLISILKGHERCLDWFVAKTCIAH